MIKSIEIINYLDESLKIELGAPETSGLWVKSIKGIGPGKASISTTDMASSDGGIFNSARSEIRNITLSLGVVERRDSDNKIVSVETTRRKLYKFFGKKREICFYINTDYKFDPSNEEDTGSSFYIVGRPASDPRAAPPRRCPDCSARRRLLPSGSRRPVSWTSAAD